jgi:hypothetical protein
MLAISATSQNWKEKHWVTRDGANWCHDLYAKFKPMVLIASWWPNYKLSGGINLDNYLEHLHCCSVCDSRQLNLLWKKWKCAGLAQEIDFSAPNSCTLQWPGKWRNTAVHFQNKECNKLDLIAAQYSDWSIIMIGPGGLLLVVPKYMQFQLQFYWWGCQKKKQLNLDI